MEWKISQCFPSDAKASSGINNPHVRLLTVASPATAQNQDDIASRWTGSVGSDAVAFSAVGFYFAQEISAKLNVPVGIICTARGSSDIETWWGEKALDGIPELRELANSRAQKRRTGQLQVGHMGDTGMYQARIHPLVPYAVRGFIWYQGETNVGDGGIYTAKMKALINGWRADFCVPNAPFYYVQIAPFLYTTSPKTSAPLPTGALQDFWLAQGEVMKIPHTGMVATRDIGNLQDIHPAGKIVVAQRLVLWALADTYEKQMVKHGPLFKSAKVSAKFVKISFSMNNSLLKLSNGTEPTGFELAGADGNFKPAKAVVGEDKKSVVLVSEQVLAPKSVRFGMDLSVVPNLVNLETLPTYPFRAALQ